MEINFIDEKIPSDKTEKTVEDIFHSAGQIMFNYYRLVLKKDIKRAEAKHMVIVTEK